MPLDTVPNCLDIINRILWTEDKARGGFYFYELVYDGGISTDDVKTLEANYLAYKQTRESLPPQTPLHPDTSTDIHTTDLQGRR